MWRVISTRLNGLHARCAAGGTDHQDDTCTCVRRHSQCDVGPTIVDAQEQAPVTVGYEGVITSIAEKQGRPLSEHHGSRLKTLCKNTRHKRSLTSSTDMDDSLSSDRDRELPYLLSSCKASYDPTLAASAALLNGKTPLQSPKAFDLARLALSSRVIRHVAHQVIETFDYAARKFHSNQSVTLPERSRASLESPAHHRKDFLRFVETVIKRAGVTIPIILCTLMYLFRARESLIDAQSECSYERLFLGALVAASKYLKDSRLESFDWASCGIRMVRQIEWQFLDAMDVQVSFSEDELVKLWDSLQWTVECEERERREYKEAMEARHEREERERMRYWADREGGGKTQRRDIRDRRGKNKKGKDERKGRRRKNGRHA